MDLLVAALATAMTRSLAPLWHAGWVASLENEIVDWSTDCPSWQISVLRRLARGEVLRAEDFIEIADRLAAADNSPQPDLRLDEMPGSNSGRSQIALRKIRVESGVNALLPGQELGIPADGMTVVYGDNGSGKSGFARLLKAMSRSRHSEDILTDIFTVRDNSDQQAEVSISVDGVDQAPVGWPDNVPAELQQVGFFDEACGDAYLATESEVTFQPMGIFLLEGLIRACDEVKNELDRRIVENQKQEKTLPTVSPNGSAEEFLRKLSADTLHDEVEAACKSPADATDKLDELVAEEEHLRSSDPNQERSRLENLARDYDTVGQHLSAMNQQLSPAVIKAAIEASDEARKLRALATKTSRQLFELEPVPGVGTQAWRALWEAARTFAEDEIGQRFPDGAKHCVLCHQELATEAKTRFANFEESVRNEAERNAADAERSARGSIDTIRRVAVQSTDVNTALRQISGNDEEVALAWSDRLRAFKLIVDSADNLSDCLAAAESTVVESDGPTAGSEEASALRIEAEKTDPSQYEARLSVLAEERTQIEDSIKMAAAQPSIEYEILRRTKMRLLEDGKKTTLTTRITNKATELARSHVATKVRDSFTRESKRLLLKRSVTLEDAGGEKGHLRFRPTFVDAVQQPAMTAVLSEGEQTALGLAGFFTEAHLDESRSAIVLDDPISSLDHIRRGLVAERLADLAKDRQVIVFTHDLVFVAGLVRAASEKEVQLAERSVERQGEKRIGVCLESHPWKAQNVKSRLKDLESRLVKIRQEMSDWQQNELVEKTSDWAGKLSETWERIISLEVVGRVVNCGTMEVRPKMLKFLAQLTMNDNERFQASYSRISQWARRHDKSLEQNYVAPTMEEMEAELKLVRDWLKHIKKYVN